MENKVSPERFYSSIESIKGKLKKAIDITGLNSTNGLCHQINFAIALSLEQEFGLPIGEYNISSAKQFNENRPAIGFLPVLNIPHTLINNHTSLLVFGVEKNPLLIDGSNDQTDSSTPFLVAQLNNQNYNATCASLRRHNRKITELPYRERGAGDSIEVRLPKTLAACKRIGVLTDEEINLMLKQFNKEKSAGLAALFTLNRDWLTYFAKALGVDYPSIQESSKKMYEAMVENGVSIPKILHQKDDMLNSLAKRLKAEGLI